MLHWHVSVLIREFLSSTFLNPFFPSSLIRNHNRSWVPTQSVMVNQWKICVGTIEWNLKPNHRGWRLTLVPVTIMNDFPQFGTPSECWTREIHRQNVVSSSQRCSGDFVSIFTVPWFYSKFPRIRYVYALNISLFSYARYSEWPCSSFILLLRSCQDNDNCFCLPLDSIVNSFHGCCLYDLG